MSNNWPKWTNIGAPTRTTETAAALKEKRDRDLNAAIAEHTWDTNTKLIQALKNWGFLRDFETEWVQEAQRKIESWMSKLALELQKRGTYNLWKFSQTDLAELIKYMLESSNSILKESIDTEWTPFNVQGISGLGVGIKYLTPQESLMRQDNTLQTEKEILVALFELEKAVEDIDMIHVTRIQESEDSTWIDEQEAWWIPNLRNAIIYNRTIYWTTDSDSPLFDMFVVVNAPEVNTASNGELFEYFSECIRINFWHILEIIRVRNRFEVIAKK